MSQAFFVKGSEHAENDPGTLHRDLGGALLDFLRRLEEGNDEHIALKFSA